MHGRSRTNWRWSCGGRGSHATRGRRATPCWDVTCHTGRMRIVSLLASGTEIVGFLGLEQQLVGVSADSDWPADAVRGLPVLNTVSFDPDQLTSREIDAAASHGHQGASLYHVDAELLRALRPDLIR